MLPILRKITLKDTEVVVKIHLAAFQGFFLSFLGKNFLIELYKGFILDPSGFGFVAEDQGKVLGFVVGTTQPNQFYKRLLLRDWWGFGWAALPALLRNPSILSRLVRAFAMPSQEMPALNCGMLMSIAVDPEWQWKGAGKLLVREFLEEARRLGSDYINLTTDALNNDPVNAFYRGLGFSIYRTYVTPEGRRINEYLIQVSKQEVSSSIDRGEASRVETISEVAGAENI